VRGSNDRFLYRLKRYRPTLGNLAGRHLIVSFCPPIYCGGFLRDEKSIAPWHFRITVDTKNSDIRGYHATSVVKLITLSWFRRRNSTCVLIKSDQNVVNSKNIADLASVLFAQGNVKVQAIEYRTKCSIHWKKHEYHAFVDDACVILPGCFYAVFLVW
jgi:hypothetical protein